MRATQPVVGFRKPGLLDGFSLVEVVLALGIVAFGLVVIFSLLPAGLVSVQEGKAQEEATDYLTLAAAELRAARVGSGLSPVLGLTVTATGNQTLTLDDTGLPVPRDSPEAAYLLTVEPRTNGSLAGPTFHLVVSWPALSQTPLSRVETLVILPK